MSPPDATAACAALQEATVQVRGDLRLFAGAEETLKSDVRTGSGFYVTGDAVVTAHHVVSKMDVARVCGAGGACRDVLEVIAWPDADLAVLRLAPGDAGRPLRTGAAQGAGQPVVAAGFPGDLGYVCGPGHLVGSTTVHEREFWLFDGTVAAQGSSGGPVVALGKKVVAIGVVSGASVVGEVRFNRAAGLGIVDLGGAGRAVGEWRHEQPWREQRSVHARLPAGRAHWEDLRVPAYEDLELSGPDEGLCYGLYRPTATLSAEPPEPIAWTCDGQTLRYTTTREELVRIGLWTDRAAGFDGDLTFRRR